MPEEPSIPISKFANALRTCVIVTIMVILTISLTSCQTTWFGGNNPDGAGIKIVEAQF